MKDTLPDAELIASLPTQFIVNSINAYTNQGEDSTHPVVALLEAELRRRVN